ncbi:MAG: tRNA 5-hydroxyuridine modification protein YegQ [Gammaproteobacteria bacterium]|nr:tRNA 5-hydroxyuridine modification protein YegQ [Gammaproteobacteria bacterium]
MSKKTELLAPAGTLKNMRYAFAYGADAVYAGQPRYSLRARNNDFNKHGNLALGIEEAHAQGKKFYLTVNIFSHSAKLKSFLADLEPVIELCPDALIMADPGLIMLVREHWPQMPVHLSVQANTMNYASVKFWQNLGLARVILSRELPLDEIAEIRRQCPDIELEVFVHGALCIAWSGRCLLSGYLNHRDANQGVCSNACRWSYRLHDAGENGAVDRTGLQPGQAETGNRTYSLEEQQRPGEFMPILEDEHGTYILNSRDLRAVQHVAKLMEIGVDSLKIEGRTKSSYYVARTAQVYRKAINDAAEGVFFDKKLMDELDCLANRGYTEGFFQRHGHSEDQNYATGISQSNRQLFVGEALGRDPQTGLSEIEVKNRFSCGDSLELMHPHGNIHFALEHMENQSGERIDVAPGSGHTVRVRLPLDEDPAWGLLLRMVK